MKAVVGTRSFQWARSYRRVPGLRDSAPPPDVKVFQALPGGKVGKLLRIENIPS